MPLILEGKCVDIIEFLSFERRLWRVLNHINRVRVFFHHGFRRNRILISVLQGKTLSISLLACADFIEGRKDYRLLHAR